MKEGQIDKARRKIEQNLSVQRDVNGTEEMGFKGGTKKKNASTNFSLKMVMAWPFPSTKVTRMHQRFVAETRTENLHYFKSCFISFVWKDYAAKFCCMDVAEPVGDVISNQLVTCYSPAVL